LLQVIIIDLHPLFGFLFDHMKPHLDVFQINSSKFLFYGNFFGQSEKEQFIFLYHFLALFHKFMQQILNNFASL
jgi:hypothetical protein